MPLQSALATFLGLIISVLIAITPAILGLGLAFVIRATAVRTPQHRVTVLPALVGGILLGLAALAIGPVPPSLGASNVFVPGGSWDITGVQLIAERVPAALDPLERVVFAPIASLPKPARLAAVAFMGAVTLAAILPLMAPYFGAVLLRLARNVAVCLLTAIAIVYLACLVTWLAALLNYWLFAVTLYAFQRWRYGSL